MATYKRKHFIWGSQFQGESLMVEQRHRERWELPPWCKSKEQRKSTLGMARSLLKPHNLPPGTHLVPGDTPAPTRHLPMLSKWSRHSNIWAHGGHSYLKQHTILWNYYLGTEGRTGCHLAALAGLEVIPQTRLALNLSLLSLTNRYHQAWFLWNSTCTLRPMIELSLPSAKEEGCHIWVSRFLLTGDKLAWTCHCHLFISFSFLSLSSPLPPLKFLALCIST